MKKEILNKERSIKTKTHQQRGATKVHQNGITLIALIITIIIMLILAGVVTNLTIGENGKYNISKQAGEDYKIEKKKKKVEQEILVLQAGKIEKNEKLTIEQALVGIKETGIFSEIDLAEEIGIADGYIIKLGYDFWDNVIIEGINKDREIRINTSMEPEGYTNGNVIIDISVKSKNVTVSNIEVPSEMIKKEDGTYEVTKNGTYIIKVTLDNGVETIHFTIKKTLKGKTSDRYKFSIAKNDKLAFDHPLVIAAGISRLKNKIGYTDIVFNMMPEYFTLGELQQVYEVILDKKLLDPAFRRIIANKVEKTTKVQSGGGHRPSALFRYKKKK